MRAVPLLPCQTQAEHTTPSWPSRSAPQLPNYPDECPGPSTCLQRLHLAVHLLLRRAAPKPSRGVAACAEGHAATCALHGLWGLMG